jgi:predicted XRE-type DNA-binding protein
MESKLKERISNCKVKKKFISEVIGVNQSVFSMCIKGDRHLSPEQETKLKNFLDKTESLQLV